MTRDKFPIRLALPLLPIALSAREIVTFPSGEIILHGALYKPEGPGPFPAVIYNHGSAAGMLSERARDALGSSVRQAWIGLLRAVPARSRFECLCGSMARERQKEIVSFVKFLNKIGMSPLAWRRVLAFCHIWSRARSEVFGGSMAHQTPARYLNERSILTMLRTEGSIIAPRLASACR